MIAEWIHGLQTGWALAVEWVERDPQPILQESGKLLASDVETQSAHGNAVQILATFFLTQSSQPGLFTGSVE